MIYHHSTKEWEHAELQKTSCSCCNVNPACKAILLLYYMKLLTSLSLKLHSSLFSVCTHLIDLKLDITDIMLCNALHLKKHFVFLLTH